MQVHVENSLARALPGVDDYTESIRDLMPSGEFGRDTMQMPNQRLVRFLGFERRGKMLSRNDQQVNGSLRIYVVKCDATPIRVDGLRRNFSSYDLAEDARLIFHLELSNVSCPRGQRTSAASRVRVHWRVA